MGGRRVGVRPNTPQWLAWRAQGVTASDAAAILGLSTWASPYSLWWTKRADRDLLADGQQLSDEFDRSQRFEIGHAMEPVLHRFFAAEVLPDGWRIGSGGCWQGRGIRSWLRATPDRCLYSNPGSRTPAGLVEFKTSAGHDEFGDDPGDGVPEIPVVYRVQMLHQMAVVGVDSGWLSVLTPSMAIRHYRVEAQPGELDLVVEAAWRFEKSLRDTVAPDVDGHDATAAAVKARYPGLDDVDVDVPADVAAEYAAATAARKDAEAAEKAAKNRLLDLIGDGRKAVCDGVTVATRSVYHRRGIDGDALKADHPDIHAAYYRASDRPIVKLTAPRPKKPPKPITEENPS